MREAIAMLAVAVFVLVMFLFGIPEGGELDVYTLTIFVALGGAVLMRAVTAVLEAATGTDDEGILATPGERRTPPAVGSTSGDEVAGARVSTDVEASSEEDPEVEPSEVESPDAPDEAAAPLRLRGIIPIVILAVYIWSIPVLGFVLSSFVGLLVLIKALGMPKYLGPLALSSGAVIAVTLLFTSALYVPLPRGVGIFGEFSVWVIQRLVL
jgi:hypothetical protein